SLADDAGKNQTMLLALTAALLPRRMERRSARRAFVAKFRLCTVPGELVEPKGKRKNAAARHQTIGPLQPDTSAAARRGGAAPRTRAVDPAQHYGRRRRPRVDLRWRQRYSALNRGNCHRSGAVW